MVHAKNQPGRVRDDIDDDSQPNDTSGLGQCMTRIQLRMYIGCGKHIDTALADVPLEQRCKCKACCQADFDKGC